MNVLVLHQKYVDKCITIITYFKYLFCSNIVTLDIFNFNLPNELIIYIITLVWDIRSEPVIVPIMHKYVYTTHLDTFNFNNVLIFKCYFDDIYSDFRYNIINNTEFSEVKPNMDYPKGLSLYLNFTPTVSNMVLLLIPGNIWDQALKSDNIELTNGVQIFNYNLINNSLICANQYKSHNMTIFIQWLSHAITNDDFLRVQNEI